MVGLDVRAIAKAQPGADGIAIAEVPSRQALVDDRDLNVKASPAGSVPVDGRRPIVFAGVEVAPGNDRHAKRGEEPRGDRVAVHDDLGHEPPAGIDRELLVPAAAAEQLGGRQRRASHFGQLPERSSADCRMSCATRSLE